MMLKYVSLILLIISMLIAACSGGGSETNTANEGEPEPTTRSRVLPTVAPTDAPTDVSADTSDNDQTGEADADETVSFEIATDELLGAVLDPPREITDFSMVSTTGEPFTLSEHKGEIILLYFGYRACPDYCPTTFAELRRLYTEMGEPAEDVKIVFVTVDPERDTMDLLQPFVNAFHEDFIGIRDDGEILERLMREFGITAEKQKLGESALSYLVDHTVSVFLIAPDGRLTVQYLFGTDYRDIMHDVELIRQS